MKLNSSDYELLLNACDSGFVILDQDKQVAYWNNWIAERTGISSDKAIGRNLKALFGTQVHSRVLNAIDSACESGQSSYFSPRLHKNLLPLKRKFNSTSEPLTHLRFSISRLTAADKENLILMYIEDQTAAVNREMKMHQNTAVLKNTKDRLIQSERDIRTLAFYDSLTGLANRHLFSESLNIAINQGKRNKSRACLMLIDIDFFKEINDTYGHDVGDKLLATMSERIRSCIRDSDTAARLGGDEFAVIFWGIDKPAFAYKLAEKITREIARPVTVDGAAINTSCSIGMSFYPDDANNTQDLYKYSDIALYEVKRNGRASWKTYSREMRSMIEHKHSIKDHLIYGINNQRITTMYQPLIDLASKRVKGFEALTRLKVNETVISPADFIPVAEEFGLINNITECSLKDIINKIPIWLKMEIQKLSINLSSIQFRDLDMMRKLNNTHKILQQYGLELEVEITESILMENIHIALENLITLTSSGISIALDDFGTGYSSLEYLSKLPIDRLKIDRSFINNVNNEADSVITNTIISLGHNLGMQVTAEGVETHEQEAYLLSKNCDTVQGFLYSKPIEIHADMDFGELAQVA